MLKYTKQFLSILLAVVLLQATGTVALAETWHLQQDQSWKAALSDRDTEYLLAVAEIKKLVNAGQAQSVSKALDEFKRRFPEIVGPDLDAFIEAELLFSKGQFDKAVRSFDKFLTEFSESQLYHAALDRQFLIANMFLNGRKRKVLKVFRIKGYATGEKIMEKISNRAGDTPLAVKAARSIADSLEKRQQFDEAYQQWSQIASRWPTGQTGKDALLAMARCKHAAYRGPKYDVSNIISAKSYYEKFRLRYPEEAGKINVEKKLEQINQQLAYKQYDIGLYYQKSGDKQSANFYYQMVLDNWPNTKAAGMSTEKIADTSLNSEKVKK